MVRIFVRRVVVVGLLVLGYVPVAAVVTSVQQAGAAGAITLYVSPGSTGTTCTISDQCGSVSKAADVATGDSYIGDDVTVQVAAGTYGAPGSGDNPSFDASSLHSLTIAGAGASLTTVDGGHQGSVFTILNGMIAITGLTITDGGGEANGGGIAIAGGTITIDNDTISNDVASNGYGGGIYDNDGGTVTVANDTLTNDGATQGGGGIFALTGQINVVNDTLNSDTAEFGGSVDMGDTASGSLADDTLAYGDAIPGGGGGVHVDDSLASATISTSIFVDSSCGTSGFTATDGGYNVEAGPDSCGFRFNSTNVVVSSYLLPGLNVSLAPNGSSGPETFELGPGDSTTSPAFELVPASVCTLMTDERGTPRPGVPGQNCDAGAYEFDPARDVAITTASLPNGSVYSKANKVTYSATVQAVGGNPPYKWSVPPGYSSHLPPGLKLRKSTGVISGKATTPGTYSFTVEVVDEKTRTKPHTQNLDTVEFSITIG